MGERERERERKKMKGEWVCEKGRGLFRKEREREQMRDGTRL